MAFQMLQSPEAHSYQKFRESPGHPKPLSFLCGSAFARPFSQGLFSSLPISAFPLSLGTPSLSSLQWPLQAYTLDLEEQVSQITLKIDKSQPSLRGFVSSSVLLGRAMETEVSIDLADREAFGFFSR